MKNATTYKVSLKSVLSSAAFVKGFSDYASRAGWNEPAHDKEQWRYERGRLFAAWLESCGVSLSKYKLRHGRWATLDAISNYNIARKIGAVL